VQENVGGAERAVRAVVGPALLAWGVVLLPEAPSPVPPVALIVMGALLSETVITKVCPASALVGVNTAAPG